MGKLKVKITAVLLIILVITLIMPVNVFAENEDIQIVKTENEDYIIYVKNLAKKEFKFAISDKNGLDINSSELTYINSVEDDEKGEDGKGNQVALIEKAEYEAIKNRTNYLYVKADDYKLIVQVSFSKAFDKEKMQQVEKITDNIKTELLTNLEEKNETIDGVKYTQTVGGLKIVDERNADYEYVSVKLPADKYSTLKELANKLNTEYETKDMYTKIEFAKEFNELYQELINEATVQNAWKSVENLEIRQPIEAQKGDQYVVLLKKVGENGKTKYDAKFLTSYREDKEEKIPGSTETKVVKETTKLPITGDNIILFVILAVIIIALIIVFIRMKKLQSKESKH